MQAVLDFLFDSSGFSPHGFCLSWQPGVLYTHLVSDILIGASYLSVAMTIFVFSRRRKDLQFPTLFLCFTVVFALCGLSHLSEIATLWLPVYGLQGAYKAMTGLSSVATAGLMWWMLPRALALPSPETLRAVNRELEHEVEERRRTELQVILAKEHAERANAAKSDFLASMSHELRTPLNAILGFSDALAREIFGALNTKQREYVGHIHSSGQHLLRLLSDLLDISRIDAGKLTLTPEAVDVAELVAGGVELVRGRAQDGGVALAVEAAPNLPTVLADPLRLTQILLNLLSNAIKFTPEGGTVRVRAAVNGAGEMEIAVADTGIGIAPEDVPRALERFTQVDNTLARKYDGAGIGLPLSKALAEMHGGRLDIASAPGRGTTVTVRLPLRPVAVA